MNNFEVENITMNGSMDGSGYSHKKSNYSDLLRDLLKKYHEISHKEKRMIVLIGGCSRSGKTTLAQKLHRDIISSGVSAVIVGLDNWVLSVDKRTGKETVRERFQYAEIISGISKLHDGKPIALPVYDHKTRTILPGVFKNINFDSGILIVEGVISLDIAELRKISHLNIYVEIDDNTRIKRLMDFYMNYKGLPQAEVEAIIRERELEEVLVVKETKKYADIIY
jgi:uridine kinase